jgi:hypothetical protein
MVQASLASARARFAASEAAVDSSVARWTGAVAPFAMQSLKSYRFSFRRHAVIASRTRRGFAGVGGDPLDAEAEFDALVAVFAAMCRSRGWRIVVLGCSEHRLVVWGDAAAIGLEGRTPGVQIIMARDHDGRIPGFHRHAVQRLWRPVPFAGFRGLSGDLRCAAPRPAGKRVLPALRCCRCVT